MSEQNLVSFGGGAAAIAPGSTTGLSEIGFRAPRAAMLCWHLTACRAGMFHTDHSIVLSR